MRSACTILSYVACLALPYFSTLSAQFSGKIIVHKMCPDFLVSFVSDISHFSEVLLSVYICLKKYQLFLSFEET